MSLPQPTQSTGTLITASIYNAFIEAINELYGGSLSVSSQATRDVFFASSATHLGRLPAGTTGQVLQTRGTSSDPNWVYPVNYATSWVPNGTENALSTGLRSGCMNFVPTGPAGHSALNGISSTGLASGTIVTIGLLSGSTLAINHNSGSAGANDKIFTLNSQGVSLGPQQSVTFVYQTSPAGWYEIGANVTGPRIRVYANAAHNATTGNFTQVDLDTEVFDYFSEFDTSSNLFTAREDMWVQIDAAASMTHPGGGSAYNFHLEIQLNGSSVSDAEHNAGVAEHVQRNISHVARLLRSDTIGLFVHHGAGVTMSIDGGTTNSWMAITRIR